MSTNVVSMDINELLEGPPGQGKIKFRVWRRLTNEQRAKVLDDVADEVVDVAVLSDIAPTLRRVNLVENCSEIQTDYIAENRLHPRSRESIDISRDTLAKEFQKIQEQLKHLEEKQVLIANKQEERDALAILVKSVQDGRQEEHKALVEIVEKHKELVQVFQESNERTMHISNINAKEGTSSYFGWGLEPGYRYKLFYGSDTYKVLEDYNYRNNVIRYVIEPIEHLQNPNGYLNSLKHVITENPAFREMLSRMRPTINLETLDDKGESRYYSFNVAMGIDQLMHELYRIFEESEEEYGSDAYKFVRRYLSRMSITVSKTPVGGAYRKEDVKTCFKLRKQHESAQRACFYHCIKAIKKEHHGGKPYGKHFDTMRAMYKNIPRQRDNYEMPLDRMKETEELFGIKLIVLANEEPQIVFDDESVKYKSYDEIKRKHHFLWKCYYFEGHEDVLDYSKVQVHNDGDDVGWVHINTPNGSERYYLMLYHDDHYYIVSSLETPSVCEKCGSLDHTTKNLTSPLIKLKCLENLQGFLDKEALKLALPEYELIFFDYETFLMNHRQCPYMVSYLICDSDLNILEKNTIEGYDCSKKFVLDITRDPSKLKYLIGFNSASFDNYFVMMDMIDVNKVQYSSNNSIIYKNKMLRLRAANVITWDLFQFAKASLEDACKAYKIDGAKGDVDHKKVWELFAQHEYNKYVFDSEEYQNMRIKEYCEKDVELTMELFKRVYKELYEFTGIDPLTKPTLSSLVYAYFNPKFKKVPIQYDYIFSSVPGGRTQVFQRGHHVAHEGRCKFALIDINSSYPNVCINSKFGTGKVFMIEDTSDEEYVKELITDTGEERLYICCCDVDQTILPIKLVGHRPKKGSTLDWTSNYVENVWLQPEVVKTLERYGCPVVKKKYLVWEKSDYMLKEKMEYLRDERMKAKEEGNKVKELIRKILGNGMTGKCGEKNHDDVWEIALDEHAIEKFKRKYHDSYVIDILKHEMFLLKGQDYPGKYIIKPRHVNARILDLARLDLWNYAMLFQPEEVYYCDTDSLIVDDTALQRLIKEEKIVLDKKKYGAMDLEQVSDEIFIVSPKNYYMNDSKMSLKSYREGDVWEARSKDTDELVCSDTKRTKEMYHCLLDDKIVVTTTFTKITKRMGRKSPDSDEFELAYLHTEETEKILE